MTEINQVGHQIIFKDGGGEDGSPREWKVLAEDL